MTKDGEQSAHPKVFISYRWTSPDHEDWVLAFATSLRESGVHAILDKWDLSEGQDTLAFMETMVNDPKVEKVLMICDRGYVERANSREGGVGTEAQIISGKVYDSVDQKKFAAIVVELNDDGKPLLPHYMATRLYFDMSSSQAEGRNFEKVVRWIFGKPFHAAPPIGQSPAYLDQTYSPATVSALSSERLRQSAARGGVDTTNAASRVLNDIATNALDLTVDLASKPDQDQIVFDAIRATFPLIEDAYRAFVELVKGGRQQSTDSVHAFFEALLGSWNARPIGRTYTRWDNDVLHYFGHECLVGFVAIAMQERAFDVAAEVLSMPLFKPRDEDPTGEAVTYQYFREHLQSLDARNQRLKLNRLSLHADLLSEHHQHSIVSFASFMEADFTLYVRGLLTPKYRWYPESAIFLGRSYGALPTYVRATSRRFYDRLKPLLFNLDAVDLRSQLAAMRAESRPLQIDYREIPLAQLLNLEGLATDA